MSRWAERVEDFEQIVSVRFRPKSPSIGGQRELAERWRRLAAMNHPAILRQLDHGEMPGQWEYDLFEFEASQPSLDWARTQELTLHQRIDLILQYLEALTLTHRCLLAYGGLTAESFRVTSSGQARLEAFPEQAPSADPVTTDLLAAIGYLAVPITESLGGKAALPRDLLLILEKGMRRNGLKGYDSIEELAADLRAVLDRKPVSPRKATLFYRGSLLARRSPELFFPAAVLLLSILLATAYSLAMDAAAQRSRSQAQNRLHQLQRLTYSLESDLYAPVSALPNSKGARDTLIYWTADSLDHLAGDDGSDLELRKQLELSYKRLAQVQRANGDAAGAVLSEQRAVTVVAAAQPTSRF